LIKILAGAYTPDSGSLAYKGRSVSWGDQLGHLSFVHQDLGLVGDMTIAENIALGSGYGRNRSGLIHWGTVGRDAEVALGRVNLDISVETQINSLSPAQRSLVAIARALAREAEVLVLDEPTATLGPHETELVFSAVRHLKSNGIGVIYVSHRMDEIFEITDRVQVLRNGKSVLEGATREFDGAKLSEAVAGRALSQTRLNTNIRRPGSLPSLSLTGVVTVGAGPVDLEIYPGEITALTGLVGAGQHAIPRMLRGDEPCYRGRVLLAGKPLSRMVTSGLTANGVTFTPTNRNESGIAPGLNVRENLIARPRNGDQPLRPLKRKQESNAAADLMERYDVHPRNHELDVLNLSGGNQQKVVIARSLRSEPRTVILEDPTIGVDVGAKADIYITLNEAAHSGTAVVVVTTDLEEVERLADRAFVFRNGLLAAELEGDEITEHRLLQLALGIAGPSATNDKTTGGAS
jgi:ribose transport system ATP-binding protein